MEKVYTALRKILLEQAADMGLPVTESKEENQPDEFYRNGQYLFSMMPDFSLRYRERSEEMQTMLDALDRLKPAYDLYNQAPNLSVGGVNGYKRLCEMGNYVLAATLHSDNKLEFVTWMYGYDRTGVLWGNYFGNDFAVAKQDFAVRAGLIDKSRLFSPEELRHINNCCAFRLWNDHFPNSNEKEAVENLGKKTDRILDELYPPSESEPELSAENEREE